MAREAGWGPHPVWTLWIKKYCAPDRIRTPDRPARRWHPILTTQPQPPLQIQYQYFYHNLILSKSISYEIITARDNPQLDSTQPFTKLNSTIFSSIVSDMKHTGEDTQPPISLSLHTNNNFELQAFWTSRVIQNSTTKLVLPLDTGE